MLGADLGVGILPVLFRDFDIGSAGRAIFGGPFEGRAGLGSAVVMVAWPSRRSDRLGFKGARSGDA